MIYLPPRFPGIEKSLLYFFQNHLDCMFNFCSIIRRQRSGTRRKLEVEMDSIADVDNENVHITSGEKTPLTQNLGSHGTLINLRKSEIQTSGKENQKIIKWV